jgi:spore coat protein CotH
MKWKKKVEEMGNIEEIEKMEEMGNVEEIKKTEKMEKMEEVGNMEEMGNVEEIEKTEKMEKLEKMKWQMVKRNQASVVHFCKQHELHTDILFCMTSLYPLSRTVFKLNDPCCYSLSINCNDCG